MTNYVKAAIAAVVALALFFGYRAIANHYTDKGRAEVQALWDKDTAARKKAEELATADRVAQNAQEKAKQDATNQTITEKYNEINNLRNQLATANRLRVGTKICSQGSSASPQATSPQGSNVPDTGTRVVSDQINGAFREFMIQVEEGFATGRACQAFIRENGFAPEQPASPAITLGTR